MEDFAGIPNHIRLMAFHQVAKEHEDCGGPLSVEEAQKLVDENPEGFYRHVKGRPIQTNLHNNYIDTRCFDVINCSRAQNGDKPSVLALRCAQELMEKLPAFS